MRLVVRCACGGERLAALRELAVLPRRLRIDGGDHRRAQRRDPSPRVLLDECVEVGPEPRGDLRDEDALERRAVQRFEAACLDGRDPGWERLSYRGVSRSPVRTSGVPTALADLLALHGLGWIAGLFEVVEPHGPTWCAWQASARRLRSRGFFAGLDEAAFDALVVFARDRQGHALACGAAADGATTFYLLTCAGCVLSLGASVDALLDRLPSRARLLFPSLEERWDDARGDWVPKHDWGLEATFVSPTFDGRETYLRAVLAGQNADALLEAALAGEPLVLALHALLARLCAAGADALDDAPRADAVEPLIGLARRRFGVLDGVPKELFAREPWRNPAVRTWAEGEHLLAMRPGPFAEAPEAIRAMPCVEPIPDDARAPLEAPRMDHDVLLARWLVAWDALPATPSLGRVRARVDAVAPSLRFAVLRRLAWDRWPTEARTYPLSEASRALIDAAVRVQQAELGGAHVASAWPLLLVYLVHATRFGYDTSAAALAALAGVHDEELTQALIALAELGWEWPVEGGRLANGASLDDRTLDRLLPTAKGKGVEERVVSLLMGRMDDDRVYELALRSLSRWPLVIAPRLVARPGARTNEALGALLPAKKLEVREAIAKALAELGDAEARRIYEETSRRIDESI